MVCKCRRRRRRLSCRRVPVTLLTISDHLLQLLILLLEITQFIRAFIDNKAQLIAILLAVRQVLLLLLDDGLHRTYTRTSTRVERKRSE